jgi:hypothetical protein
MIQTESATTNTNSLAEMFAAHEQALAAFAALPECTSDDEIELANDKLWELSDRIIESEVNDIGDLLVKVHTTAGRWEISDGFISALEDYFVRIIADTERLAAAHRKTGRPNVQS